MNYFHALLRGQKESLEFEPIILTPPFPYDNKQQTGGKSTKSSEF